MDLEFHPENCNHFLKYFGLYILITVNAKTILGIFVLFIYEVTMTKVNFCFQKQCSQAVMRLI